MLKNKYDRAYLEKIIKESTSQRQVLAKLHLPKNGGYKQLRDLIKTFDTKHFVGKGWCYVGAFQMKNNDQYFCMDGTKKSSHSVRINLLKRKIKDKKCESCGLFEWLGKDIPLEVNHKNGNKLDNRLSNLEILCPNCHYFTPNYKIKNRKEYKARMLER